MHYRSKRTSILYVFIARAFRSYRTPIIKGAAALILRRLITLLGREVIYIRV